MISAGVRVDWVQLALNLRSRGGLPLSRASVRIGRHRSFLPQLARGEVQEPKFSDGIELLDLHFDVCGPELTKALLK